MFKHHVAESWFRSANFWQLHSETCENATDKRHAQAMTASPISCCSARHARARLACCCCCTSSKLPILASRPLRRLLHQPRGWKSSLAALRIHRPRRSCRSSVVYAVVSTASCSAGSGVSFLFAASTLYCVPLFALVSKHRCCCNRYFA